MARLEIFYDDCPYCLKEQKVKGTPVTTKVCPRHCEELDREIARELLSGFEADPKEEE